MTTILSPYMISGSAGPIAVFVDKQRYDSLGLLQESNALGMEAKGVIRQLNEVSEECSSAGWDGKNAAPITEETRHLAKIFLKSLPWGTEAPEIGVEPDGAITLEWYRSPRKVLSVSIDPDGWIYHAALIGPKRRQGVDYGTLSDDLIKRISEITKES